MLHARHLLDQVSSLITITGLGDHDQPDWLITMTGIRTLSPIPCHASTRRQSMASRSGTPEFRDYAGAH